MRVLLKTMLEDAAPGMLEGRTPQSESLSRALVATMPCAAVWKGELSNGPKALAGAAFQLASEMIAK